MDTVSYNSLTKVFAETPLWVWAWFGYLLVMGVRALHHRLVFIPQLFITPAVLIGLKYNAFFSTSHVWLYLVALCIGSVIGFSTSSTVPIRILKNNYSIELPGTSSTLVLVLVFFCVKYLFEYLMFAHPVIALKYRWADHLITGGVAGYFLGRAVCYAYRFCNYQGLVE